MARRDELASLATKETGRAINLFPKSYLHFTRVVLRTLMNKRAFRNAVPCLQCVMYEAIKCKTAALKACSIKKDEAFPRFK